MMVTKLKRSQVLLPLLAWKEATNKQSLRETKIRCSYSMPKRSCTSTQQVKSAGVCIALSILPKSQGHNSADIHKGVTISSKDKV